MMQSRAKTVNNFFRLTQYGITGMQLNDAADSVEC